MHLFAELRLIEVLVVTRMYIKRITLCPSDAASVHLRFGRCRMCLVPMVRLRILTHIIRYSVCNVSII